jgi:hypothetical protein
MGPNCFDHAATLSRSYRGSLTATDGLLDLAWFTAVMDLSEPVL